MNAAFENIPVEIRHAIERIIKQETAAGRNVTPEIVSEILHNEKVNRIAEKGTAEGREITPDEQKILQDKDYFKESVFDFYNAFRYKLTDGSGNIKYHSTVVRNVVAGYINEHYHYLIIDELFYIYENGVYTRDTKNNARISLIINNLIAPEHQSRNRTAEVIAALKTPDHIVMVERGEISTKTNTHAPELICFKNGVFDAKEWKLLPHDPEYRFLNQIPHVFDPNAPEPPGEIFAAYLDSILPGSTHNRTTLMTTIGYCMTTDVRMQKMLVLKGRPGTGKSQLLNLIQYIIGEENCSAESLEALNGNRFRAYKVVGKLCNINADLTTEGSIDPSIIKQLVGEDRSSVERKGMDSYDLRPYAKHLFSMNNFPVIKAKDSSFYRRVMILPMDIIPEKIDQGLQEKLRSQADYVIRMAMTYLNKYYNTPEDQRDYIESPESKRLVEEWQFTGDSVSAYLTEENPFADKPKIQREDLFKGYKNYCDNAGREPLSAPKFYNALKADGYTEKRTSANGKTGIYLFIDPNFKEPDFDAAKPDETPFGNN